MRTSTIFLSAIALANSARAFFPFYPDYVCATTMDCSSSKHTVESREPGLDIKIVQRLPKNKKVAKDHVLETARRMRRKYQLSRPSSDNVKRTNTYTIMTAATPSQASSAGINQDGTDFSYFAQVQIGSANKPMYMLIDTGADSSWVMGSDCKSDACSIHNSFDPSTSTTFKPLGQSFGVQYGSGSVSGIIGTDSFTLAGLKLPMTFGVANITSTDFNNFPMDGILGLSLGESANPSFVDALVGSKALKSNLFGMSLNRASDGPNTGEINFGAPNTARYSGSLTYVPVSSDGGGFWSVPMGNAGAGTTQSGITTKLAFIDSGTSFIFCNEADAKTFHAIVPGATTEDNMTYHVPCTTTMSLSFTFGGTTFAVSSKDWVSAPSNGVCTSNIYGHDIVGGNWLLGDTYLKNVYTVFDIDQKRVGFAAKSQPVASSTSTTVSTSASLTTGTPSTATTGVTFTASSLLSSASATGSTTSSPGTGTPGLNGHESMSVLSGTAAAAQTTSPSSTPAATKNSGTAPVSSTSSGTSVLVWFLVAAFGAIMI